MSKGNVLVRMLHGHASELQEIVLVLTLGYGETLQPRGWHQRHSGKGANSYSWYKGNKQLHFRKRGGKGKMEIHVFDSYRKGKLVAVLKTYWDARRFVDKVATL